MGRSSTVAAAVTWHVVTGEFPPQTGGVSDYTFAVTRALATEGQDVHVWCPAADDDAEEVRGITVHRDAGHWHASDLRRLDRALDALPGPRRLLIQWVPQAFGRRSLNIGFCRWARRRAAMGDELDVMVHEPFLPFGEGRWRHDVAAAVQRGMAAVLLGRATRVWVSIPAWTAYIARYCANHAPIRWLPVPSGIPVVPDAEAVRAIRRRMAQDEGLVIGLFGPYGGPGRDDLGALVGCALDARPGVVCLALGRGSDEFRQGLTARRPDLAARVHATGELAPQPLSTALQACDLIALPFPDGASSRRTTLMAALAHGLAVVTTDGRLSEPLWRESGAVRLTPARDPAAMAAALVALGDDAETRSRLAAAGRRLYDERFDVSHTVQALIAPPS